MSQALEAYLVEVGSGLKGLTARRRLTLIRELKAHLLDEAEARGISSDSAMTALLEEKEHPRRLAEEIALGEGQDANHRGGTALAAGMIIGLATGVHLVIEG